MIRVQKNPEYSYPHANLKNRCLSIKQEASFAGKVNVDNDELVRETVELVNKRFSSIPGRAFKRVNEFLDGTKDEIQSQALNAVFTCTLAPLVIWKNPFYHKDEDQKKYFALRQPVSAAIAMTGGLAMTLGINRWLDGVTNDGMIESIDSRIKPTDKYLTRMYKQEKKSGKKPEEYISQKHLEAAKKEIASNPKLKNPSNFIDRWRVKNIYLEAYKNTVRDERKELFKALFGENKANLRIKDSVISVKRNGKWVELARNIPNLTTKEQFNAYIKKNNLHEISFADFLKKYYGFEIYQDGILKGNVKATSMAMLDEIKAMDFLRDSGLAGKATLFKLPKQTAKKIKENKGKPPKVADNINEESLYLRLRQLSDSKTEKNFSKTKAQAIGKSGSRAAKLGNGGIHGEKIRLFQLFEQIDHMEIETNLNEKLEQKAAEVFDIIGEKLDIVIKKGEKSYIKAKPLDFASNILDTRIARLSRFENYAALMGLITNLVTTIISCSALNWAYPRFVETFFPKIAHSGETAEQKKGGNA